VSLDNLPELLQSGNWTIVAGSFDPLTLAQARRVEVFADDRQKVLVVVIPGADTLLSAEARAVLVAGLRSVNAVVIAKPEQITMPGVHIDEDAAGERERSAEFVRFMLRRLKSEEVPA
jgi:hypothetical protein